MYSNVHDDVTVMFMILKFVDSPKTQTSQYLESESYKRRWYGENSFLVKTTFNV